MLLYDNVSSSSLSGIALFKRFSGFLGTMNVSDFGQLTSFLLYLTKRCASVATQVSPFLSNSKNTPVIAGRRSSLLTANRLLLIAETKAEEVILKEFASSATGSFGKLSGFSPITLYFPLSLVISIPKFLSIVKVNGCSAMFFSESINILAGIQTLPLSLASTSR